MYEALSDGGLGQDHIHLLLEVRVEALEQILEQQRDQRAGQLEALVTVVVLVVEQSPALSVRCG